MVTHIQLIEKLKQKFKGRAFVRVRCPLVANACRHAEPIHHQPNQFLFRKKSQVGPKPIHFHRRKPFKDLAYQPMFSSKHVNRFIMLGVGKHSASNSLCPPLNFCSGFRKLGTFLVLFLIEMVLGELWNSDTRRYLVAIFLAMTQGSRPNNCTDN